MRHDWAGKWSRLCSPTSAKQTLPLPVPQAADLQPALGNYEQRYSLGCARHVGGRGRRRRPGRGQVTHAERLQALDPIGDVDGAVAAHRHAERGDELARIGPGLPPRSQELPVAIEDLHAMVRVVGHEHPPRGVHCRVHGVGELPVAGARPSPPIEEFALRGEALHAAVIDLGDQERAVGVEPDPERSPQLPRLQAALAPFGQESPIRVEDLCTRSESRT